MTVQDNSPTSFGIQTGPSQTGQASLPPEIDIDQTGPDIAIWISGDWQIKHAKTIARKIKKNKFYRSVASKRRAEIHIEQVANLDTAGAMLLLDYQDFLASKGMSVEIVGASEAHQLLFDVISRHPREQIVPMRHQSMLLNLVRDLGATTISIWRDCIEITNLIGRLVLCFFVNIVRPWRFRLTSLVHHMEHAGLKAVSIIALICLLIGAVIMQQSAEQLRQYAAEHFAIDMLGILALREVGVLLTSVMIAGRSGAAITAEIGSMKMREEIDAMRALGIDPMETLILPRVLALMIVLPLLTFIGDIMCLVGGAIAGWTILGIDYITFLDRLKDNVDITHFYVGMIKTPFVAIIIGLVGALEGMRVRGSAESLGEHVRAAVVKSIFLVIILDAVFAIFLTAMGI